MFKKIVSSFIALCLVLTGFAINAAAATAQNFYIKVSPAEEINVEVDHYKISVVRGWISDKDSFFKSLLSQKGKLVVSMDEEITFFDNDKLNISNLYENTDIKKDTNLPWGQSIILLDNISADAGSKLNIRLAIHRDSRITQLFDGLKASEGSLGSDVLAAPWVGYAKAIGNIFNGLFQPSQTTIPFSWVGNIKVDPVMANPKVLLGHYIVLVAPNKPSDTFPVTALGDKFSYNAASQQLTYSGAPYNGNAIADRSFLVLKVSKAEGYNIKQLLFESSAPWAELALAQFLVIPTGDAKNLDQLTTLSKNLTTQLQNEIRLLKREHRFSKFDRAVTLRSFATDAKDEVSKKCSSLQLTQCPTDELQQIIDHIEEIFELTIDQKTRERMRTESERVRHEIKLTMQKKTSQSMNAKP